MRRVLELSWPTLLVAAACVGLAGANWLRPGALLLAAAIGSCAAVACARPQVSPIAVAGLLLFGGLWWGGLRLDALERSVLSEHIGESARARVVLTGPPHRGGFSIRVPAEVRTFDGRDVRERVLLELPPERAPPQGAVLELSARVVAPRGPETGFDERAWLARRGVHVVVEGRAWHMVGRRGGIGGVADRLRAQVARSLALGTRGERRALTAGVVLGADEDVAPDLQAAFRASGLYHLMAVSGQNVAFVIGGTLGVAWLLGVSRLVGQAAAIVAVGAYVLAVGWQPSVVRAAVAGCLASLAWLVSRPRDRWHFLALGALVLLVWTPASLLDPGFQLSFSAVAAIFVAVPPLRRRAAGYPLPTRLVEGLAVATACGLVTAPILWFRFGAVPLWTVPANALAEPAMPLVLGCGLAAAAVQPVVPSAAVALAWIGGLGAAWLAFCARFFASLPSAQIHSGATLLIVAAGLLFGAALVHFGRRRGQLLVAAAIAVAVVLLVRPFGSHTAPPAPPTGLRVTFLDVGQGDAALLQVRQGAILVDEGPPEADVARQLRRLGVHSLAAMVLTHPQRDHIGGAADVLRLVSVGEVIDPGLPADSRDEADALAAAAARHVPIVLARTGQVFRLGRLRLQVLWPDGPGSAGADPNDRAVVLLASYGQVDVLLTADAESPVTSRLVTGAVEVLKVAHHGSEDPGLAGELSVLRPRVAVISVGAGNDYGHPRAETIAALEAVPGVRLLRTDLNGRVVVETDGRRLGVTVQRN